MTNINLSYSREKSDSQHKRSFFSAGSIIISSVVLVISGLVYGGLKMFNNKMNIEKEELANRIQIESRLLDGKEAVKISNFARRINFVETNLENKTDPNTVLSEISKSVVGGSLVKSFNLDAKHNVLELEMENDNFLAAAKQLFSFKKSTFFKDTVLTEIAKGEKGKVFIVLKTKI